MSWPCARRSPDLAAWEEFHPGEVPFPILRAHLATVISETETASGFIAGHVTFCSLKPMRSIPFRVVCMLGMSDGEFPRRDVPIAFDLLAEEGAAAGRSRRDEDRQLFLEAMLSARDVFYLSYTGLSTSDNSELPPSVVVSELIDYLSALAPGTPSRGAHRAPPAAAFLPRLLRQRPALLVLRAKTARPSSTPRPRSPRRRSRPPSWTGRRSNCAPSPSFSAPRPNTSSSAGSAPGCPKPRRRSANPSRWPSTSWSNGSSPAASPTARSPAARPRIWLPASARPGSCRPGILATRSSTICARKIEPLLDKIADAGLGELRPPQLLEAGADDWKLHGTLDTLHAGGLRFVTAWELKPKDRLRAWAAHLLLNAAAGPATTWIFATNEVVSYQPRTDALELLAGLVALFREGQTRPLPVFAKSSFEFAKRTLFPKKNSSPAGVVARKVYDNRRGRRIRITTSAFAIPPIPCGPEWEALALRLWTPLLTP